MFRITISSGISSDKSCSTWQSTVTSKHVAARPQNKCLLRHFLFFLNEHLGISLLEEMVTFTFPCVQHNFQGSDIVLDDCSHSPLILTIWIGMYVR